MSQKTIGIVIVIVLLLGGGAAYMMYKPTSPSSMMERGMSDTTATQDNGGSKSLQDLLAAGRPQTCTFSDQDDNANSSGTIFVAQGKVRGDFTTTASGKTTMSHMLVKDKTSYIWTSDSKQGMKMMIDESLAAKQPETPTQNPQGVDPNKKMNYSCSPWSADENQFSLPTDVTFTELNLNAMMQTKDMMGAGTPPSTNMPQTLGNTKPSQCGICDSLPAGASRDQCKKSLGC